MNNLKLLLSICANNVTYFLSIKYTSCFLIHIWFVQVSCLMTQMIYLRNKKTVFLLWRVSKHFFLHYYIGVFDLLLLTHIGYVYNKSTKSYYLQAILCSILNCKSQCQNILPYFICLRDVSKVLTFINRNLWIIWKRREEVCTVDLLLTTYFSNTHWLHVLMSAKIKNNLFQAR